MTEQREASWNVALTDATDVSFEDAIERERARTELESKPPPPELWEMQLAPGFGVAGLENR